MKYIIIGLGNYGSVLAEELSALGHEVIGVDTNERRVDVLKDKIATSFIIDATDEQSLSVLPLKDVDVVIVHSCGGIIEKKRSETYLCACGG
mgnify:CR=1 FL=1